MHVAGQSFPADGLPGGRFGGRSGSRSSIASVYAARPAAAGPQCEEILESEGLLHDARNLIGALGLYCDLLSMPGVLKPEHRHYAEDVRLLGSRSAAMIERLMEHQIPAATDAKLQTGPTYHAVSPVSLRSVIQRSAGLLSRVAGGRAIEVCYGIAAAVPVRVTEEALERILINLVSNAAAALAEGSPVDDTAEIADEPSNAQGEGSVRELTGGGSPGEQGASKAIRIGVGMLVNRVGDPKPWPLRRVRLTVEDSGCGMAPGQLDRLLRGTRAPARGRHGIGFRVVRELVAGSGGDLQVMSALGAGTRVQIEWPVALPASNGTIRSQDGSPAGAEWGASC